MISEAITDLGEMKGPLLIFGGPYSNLEATTALREQAAVLGIAPENIICTGDVVAYCASLNETVALLRDWGCRVLMGNCEESLAAGADDCGCGFGADTTCSLLSVQWYRYADKHISAEARAWMRNLPRQMRFNFADRNCLVVHGAVSSINRFVFASTDIALKQKEIEQGNADIIIAGHSGLPFTQQIGDRIWHNAGVIGMPANDGAPDVWYSLIKANDACESQSTESPKMTIEHRRLSYDCKQARRKMLNAGLVNGYADALISGLWPSMDVLPERERKQQGQIIKLSDAVYF